jgi:preprotein translocase subunit SecD
MKLRIGQFNLILAVAGALLLAGCSTGGPSLKRVKHPTLLQFHLEVNRDGTDRNYPVTVNRSSPFQVNVLREAFLIETHIMEAAVVNDAYGGFSIRVKLNKQGTWILEQYTTANKGKRVAIFTTFEKTTRWLGAPVMDKRIADGTFSFTPDASRQEADLIVLGLNELGKQVKEDEI